MEQFAPLARTLFALVVVWVAGFYPLILFYYARAYRKGGRFLIGPFFPLYIFSGTLVLATLSALTLTVMPLSELGWWETTLLLVTTILPVILRGPLRRWSLNARKELAAERHP